MLNMNSPTVQAMLSRTPNGVGNIPLYYGSSPVMTGTVEPVPQQQNPTLTPFPSPKEMLISGGQNMVYNPTSFAPRNIVGGYNPGYNAMFSGYSNPYMGYGSYAGFPAYGYNQFMMPMDDDARDRQMRADINGLTYDEQLIEESNFYKTVSRIVSKNLGRSEEEAKECEEAFNIYNKHPKQEEFGRKKIEPIHVQIKVGEEVVADFDPENSQVQVRSSNEYQYNIGIVENMKMRENFNRINQVNRMNMLYNSAVERRFDNTDLLDFLNNGAGAVMSDMMIKEMQMRVASGISQLYDSDGFRQSLFEKNGIRTKKKMKAVERFVGRYGVMPDGRPVSPGTDPAIAESFSYNPNTGQYSITAPNFIQNRIEQARQAFLGSIGK